jgi:hypothetical protein
MPNGNGHPANLLHLPHWDYSPKLKGLSGIYLNTAIRNLAFGILGIFIPIYIYQVTHSITDVFLFYLIHRTTTLVTVYPSAKLIHRIGPDIAMLLSSVLAAIYLTLLSSLTDTPSLIWITAIFGGIQLGLHWIPYHTAFADVTKEKKLSKGLTNVSNLTRLIRTLAPLAGGLVAAKFGFPTLLLMGVLMLIVSSLPVFFDEYDKKEKIKPLRELIDDFYKTKDKTLFYSLFFQGFRIAIDGAIWPIILYSVLPDLQKIGGLTTITLIVSFAAVNWVGKRLKHFKIQPLIGGNVARSFIWLIRAITNHPLIIALTDPFYQFATIFVNVPRSILIYQLGKRRKLNFFTQRELAISFGRVVSLGLVFIILKAGYPWKFIPLLPIASITLGNYYLYQYSKARKSLLENFRIKLTRL